MENIFAVELLKKLLICEKLYKKIEAAKITLNLQIK
jgi:hypothetical protein